MDSQPTRGEGEKSLLCSPPSAVHRIDALAKKMPDMYNVHSLIDCRNERGGLVPVSS